MAHIQLLQPVPGASVSLRFFNGRLLTGADLTREQQMLWERDRQRGRAIGQGVVSGLDVGVDQSAVLTLTIAAGEAINRHGDLVVLHQGAELALQVPTPIPEYRPDWRRCADKPATDQPESTAGLFLLSICPQPVDGSTHARVLQIDRGNDPCTIDAVVDAAFFRLTRLTSMEATLAAETPERLRSAAAHLCFGSDQVPDRLEGDAPGRAVAEVLGADADLDCDVPLALVRLRANRTIEWVDMWSVRRRPTAPSTHTKWERLTGPRAVAEAEARLLQFQEQALTLPMPAAPALDVGSCAKYLRFLPPAGELDPAWLANDAWRTFFGLLMAPSELVRCDPRLLASLLARASLARAIPTAIDAGSAPAVSVLLGVPAGSTATALVFVQSERSRVRIGFRGTLMTAAVAAVTKVLVRRRWCQQVCECSRIPETMLWLSPDLDPGDWRIEVDSPVISAEPREVETIAGRVQHEDLDPVAITGTLEVQVSGIKASRVTRVVASHAGDDQAVVLDGSGRGSVRPAAIGSWTVTAWSDRAGSRSVTVTVVAEQTALATIVFDDRKAPVRQVQFDWQEGAVSAWLEIAMLDLALVEEHDSWRIDGPDYFASKRQELDARPVYELPHRSAVTTVKHGGSGAREGKPIYYRTVAQDPMPQEAIVGYLNWGMRTDHRLGYTTWNNPPAAVITWLHEWQSWLAWLAVDPVAAEAIAVANPFIRLRTGETPMQLATKAGAPKTAEGWAVFGPTVIPLVFKRLRSRVVGDFVPPDWRPILDFYDLLPERWRRPSPLDLLAAMPEELLQIRFPFTDPPAFHEEIRKRAEVVADQLEFVPGMTPQILDRVGNLVGLANADPGQLGVGLPIGQFLVGQARTRVARNSWSVLEAGLAGGAGMVGAGFVSMGDVARAEPSTLASLLAVESAVAASFRESVREQLGNVLIAEMSANIAVAGGAGMAVTGAGNAGGGETHVDLSALGNNPAATAERLGVSREVAERAHAEALRFNARAAGMRGIVGRDAPTRIRLRGQ